MFDSFLFHWRGRRSVLGALALGLGVPAALVTAAGPALAAPPHFALSQLVAAPGALSNLAAVSTSSTTEEVFYVPQNGSVQEKYFNELNGWNTTEVAPPGSAAPFADIAAVTRDRNTIVDKIDLFWIGPSGSVEHSYFQDGLPWLRYPSVASAGSASTSGSLAAVSRANDTWEIFWVSPSGDVDDAWHYDSGAAGQFVMAPHSTSTPGVSYPRHIAAVSRASNTMEVFWIGQDGSIQDHYYYDGAGWNQFPQGLYPAGTALGLGSPAGAITVVSRASNTMELWFTGRDYSVQDAYWYQGGFWNRFTLAGANSMQSAIASAAPVSSAMDVFWNGYGSGTIELANFGPPWAVSQVAPAGPPSQGNVAAVSRAPNHLDVFYVTFNGGIDEAAS
jgi:hypothetical protein